MNNAAQIPPHVVGTSSSGGGPAKLEIKPLSIPAGYHDIVHHYYQVGELKVARKMFFHGWKVSPLERGNGIIVMADTPEAAAEIVRQNYDAYFAKAWQSNPDIPQWFLDRFGAD